MDLQSLSANAARVFGFGAKPNEAAPNNGVVPGQQGTANPAAGNSGQFGTTPPNQQQQATNQQQQQPTQGDPNLPNNDPLAEFKGLWDTPAVPEGQEAPVDPMETLVPWDTKKVSEAVQKLSFIPQISNEDLAKMEAGGKDGLQTMMKVINSASQKNYQASASVTQKMVMQALKKYDAIIQAKIPDMVKQHGLTESFAENPAFQDPAVRPMLLATMKQLQTQFPTATQAELQKKAQSLMTGMATKLSGGSSGNNSQNGNGAASRAGVDDTDFASIFET